MKGCGKFMAVQLPGIVLLLAGFPQEGFPQEYSQWNEPQQPRDSIPVQFKFDRVISTVLSSGGEGWILKPEESRLTLYCTDLSAGEAKTLFKDSLSKIPNLQLSFPLFEGPYRFTLRTQETFKPKSRRGNTRIFIRETVGSYEVKTGKENVVQFRRWIWEHEDE
jgi:hypothetical protein